MKRIIFFIIIFLFFGCSDFFAPENDNLPSEFPLKIGQKWIYDRTYYSAGEVDSVQTDTLFIVGKWDDYYLYSWNPSEYFSLVRNYDNKLVNFGSILITNADTLFHQIPYVWAFYEEKENSVPDLEGYNYFGDSLFISVSHNEKWFGKIYDTYKLESKGINSNYYRKIVYYNILGFVKWEYFDAENNLIRKTVMVEN